MLSKIAKNKKVALAVVLFLVAVAVGLGWFFKSRQPKKVEKKEAAFQGIKKGAVEFFDSTQAVNNSSLSETSPTGVSSTPTSTAGKVFGGGKTGPKMQRIPKLNAVIPADIKVHELTTQTIDKLEKPLLGMASGDVLEVKPNGCKLKLSSFVALEAEKKGNEVEKNFYFLVVSICIFYYSKSSTRTKSCK